MNVRTRCGATHYFVVKEADNHLSWMARRARCQKHYDLVTGSQVVLNTVSTIGNWYVIPRL